jgi:hypothetical protein
MQFFLKAKAWQIFLLTFVIPFGVSFLAAGLAGPSEGPPLFLVFALPFMALFFLGVTLPWYWSLGKFFKQGIRQEVRPKDTWFRRGLIYVSIYVTAYLAFWVVFILAPKNLWLAAAMAILFVFHLLAMAAMFYVLYFVARGMTMVEEEREKPSGKSTAGNFLLLWFFPIGVWFIQPMVNRMWRDKAF